MVTLTVTEHSLLPKMPKLVSPLTSTQIKNAKPSTKPTTMFDGMETGLHLLVQPNGTKTFRLKIQIDGRDRRLTLGTFPDMSLAEAREETSKTKKQVKQGVDPTAPIVVNTFARVADKFIEWKKSILSAEATIRKYKECLKNDLLPAIGNKDIARIHTAEIVPLLERINKRSNSLAIKNQELVGMIIKYAVQRGYRPPYTQLDLSGLIPRKPRTPKVIPNDIPATFKRIDEYPESVMRYAMKLQFYGFLRSSETMGAEWNEFDFKKREWHVPKERMKMRRPHVVPLARQIIILLKELKKITGETPCLFPSMHNQKAMCNDALSKAFRSINLVIVPHGCRTAAGAWMRNNRFAPHLVESQLSHVEKNEIAAAYQNEPHLLYLEERHRMMQAWADYLFSKSI
jgi:integrase